MPRFRFTLRRMLLIVAVAAIVLGTFAGLRRRAERSRRLALSHASQAQSAADTAWGFQRFGINPDGSVPEESARQADHYWKRYGYHEALRAEYERVARYPWLSVEPDPPELR